MEVARKTPEQLILGNSPWATGFGLIIFVIILTGAGMMLWQTSAWLSVPMFFLAIIVGFFGFLVFVNRVQAVFHRPDNRLLITRRSIFGQSATEYDLSQLAGAIAEEFTTSEGRRLHRPTLVLLQEGEEERVPVVETYSNEDGVQVLVDAINEWLPADKGLQSLE